MLGVKEYMNSDANSECSIETYYSHENVSSDHEVSEEEDEYYEEHFMEEVPYASNPVVIHNPLRQVNTKVPEINPWSKLKQEEKNVEKPKSFLEILEEEKCMKEKMQQKAKENEQKKARFQRRKVFHFQSKDRPSESLLLKKAGIRQPSK